MQLEEAELRNPVYTAIVIPELNSVPKKLVLSKP
jgi:hypothetical protein